MKKSRFAEEQIAFALRQAEGGTQVREICRKLGVSEQTYYRWRREYGGLKVDQAKRPLVPACHRQSPSDVLTNPLLQDATVRVTLDPIGACEIRPASS